MNFWRARLQQIGGPNAISRWSWIITIPLVIVVSSNYAVSPSISDILIWQSIVLVVHVLLGLMMWLAWKTILPNTNRASRPVTALVFFGSLGLVRALLMQLAQDTVGISGGVLSERLAVNIVGSIVALSAIAIIVDDYRTDAAIVRRLGRAQDALARLCDQEQVALQAADIEVLAEVQGRVTNALNESGGSPEQIRAVANEIVRPISHELAAESTAPVIKDGGDSKPGLRLTFREAFGRMQAPSPLVLAIVVEATILGAVVIRYGPLIAFGNLLIGGGLIFLGCYLVRRFVPLPLSPSGRLGVLALALAGVGAVATELTSLVIPQLNESFPAALIGVALSVAGAGVALSLWVAVNAGRQIRQQAMAEAVAREAAEVDRVRSLIEQRRLQASRFLHGTIQGELVAAALRHDDPDTVRELIAKRFAEYGSTSSRPADQQIRNLIEAWSTVLNISTFIDDECWVRLAGNQQRTEVLVEALSEALTNVVRHASEKAVDICLTALGPEVKLTVKSHGVAKPPANSGIGLAQLRARGALITLEPKADGMELAAVV